MTNPTPNHPFPERTIGPSRTQTCRPKGERPPGTTHHPTDEMNAEEKATLARSLQARFEAITELHRQTPPQASKQTASTPPTPDERAVRAAFRAAALSSIGRFDRTRRAQAKAAADNLTNQWLLQARHHNEQLRAQHQAILDEQWRRLLTNDPAAVLPALEHVFAGKAPRVAVAGLAGTEVSLAIAAPPLSKVPDRKPAVTDAGNLSLKRLTKTETNAWYRLLLAGHIVLTAKRAFAAAPGLATAHIAVLDPDTSGALIAATVRREALAHAQQKRADKLLDSAADRTLLRTTGSAQTLVPFALSAVPGFRTTPARPSALPRVAAPTYLLEPPPSAFLPVIPTTPPPHPDAALPVGPPPAGPLPAGPLPAAPDPHPLDLPDAPPPPYGVPPEQMSPAARRRSLGVVAAALVLILMVVGWVNGPGKPTYTPRAPMAYAALPDALPKALTVRDVWAGGHVIVTDPLGTERKVALDHILVPSSTQCLTEEVVAFLEALLLGATVEGVETGELTVDGTLVAAELARAGLAVADPNGTTTDPEYRKVVAAQEEAHAALLGLYSEAEACTVPAQVAAYVALAASLSTETDSVIAFAVLETPRVDALTTRIEEASRVKEDLARHFSRSAATFPLVPFTAEEIEAFRAQVAEADSIVEAAITRTDERIAAEELRLEQEAAAAAAAAAAAEEDRLREESAAAAAAAAEEAAAAAASSSSSSSSSVSVYYPNCTAARAAGAAPLYIGEPGYRSALDRDKDGVACE